MGTSNSNNPMIATMELADIFNDELRSIVHADPPITRSKMESIKIAAMKARRQYKHVVHHVEKFMAKCEPKYKLPTLHVIDSIVRQSLHQFTRDNDVYAERFGRNLYKTFVISLSESVSGDKSRVVRILDKWHNDRIFTSQTLQPLLKTVKKLAKAPAPTTKALASNSSTVQTISNLNGSKEVAERPRAQPSLPNVQGETDRSTVPERRNSNHDPGVNGTSGCDQRNLSPTRHPTAQENKDNLSNGIVRDGAFDSEIPGLAYPSDGRVSRSASIDSNNIDYDKLLIDSKASRACRSRTPSPRSERSSLTKSDPFDNKHTSTGKRHRRESDRSARQESSADSHNQSRTNREARQTTPIVAENRQISISASSETITPHRQLRCLPAPRADHVTVGSSTLWVGHLPRTAAVSDLSDVFGMFGIIASIDHIHPRGCAFICMDRRQDAARIVENSDNIRLFKNKIRIAWAPGKGLNTYGRVKDYWNVGLGASFIPHEVIDESIDLDTLEEGGVIDDESLTPEMRQRRKKIREYKDSPETSALFPANLIPPALLLLQQHQQQQQLLSSLANMTGRNGTPNVPLPPMNIGQMSLPPPPLPLPPGAPPHMHPAPNQHGQISSLYGLPAHVQSQLMLNNPYIQGLIHSQNQPNPQFQYGQHLQLPISGMDQQQQQHFIHTNLRASTLPGDLASILAPGLMGNPAFPNNPNC